VQETVRSIFWLIEKELKCLFRDPDILIYGLIAPLVFFPLVAVCVSETMFWYQGMQEHKKLRVALIEHSDTDARFDEVRQAIAENKYFQVVQSSDPARALKSRAIEASLEFVDDTFKLATNEALADTTDVRLTSLIRERSRTDLLHELKEHGLTEQILAKPFKIEEIGLGKVGTGAYAKTVETLGFYLISLMLCGAFCEMMLVGGAACLCVLTAEKEQRTFYTTLLAPVSRYSLVFAKLITCSTVAITSGLIYLFCLLGVLVTVLKPMLPNIYVLFDLFKQADLTFWFLTMAALVSATILGCASTFVLAVFGTSLREGQILISTPLLASVLLATMSALPGTNINSQTALVPYLNMFLLIKEGHPSAYFCALAFVETICLIAACVYFVGKMMVPDFSLKRLSFVPGGAGGSTASQKSGR